MKFLVLVLALAASPLAFAKGRIPDFSCDNQQESSSDGYFRVSYSGGRVVFHLYEGKMIAEASDLTITGQEIAIERRELQKVVEGEAETKVVEASLNYNPGPRTLAVTLIVDGKAWHAEEVLRCN